MENLIQYFDSPKRFGIFVSPEKMYSLYCNIPSGWSKSDDYLHTSDTTISMYLYFHPKSNFTELNNYAKSQGITNSDFVNFLTLYNDLTSKRGYVETENKDVKDVIYKSIKFGSDELLTGHSNVLHYRSTKNNQTLIAICIELDTEYIVVLFRSSDEVQQKKHFNSFLNIIESILLVPTFDKDYIEGPTDAILDTTNIFENKFRKHIHKAFITELQYTSKLPSNFEHYPYKHAVGIVWSNDKNLSNTNEMYKGKASYKIIKNTQASTAYNDTYSQTKEVTKKQVYTSTDANGNRTNSIYETPETVTENIISTVKATNSYRIECYCDDKKIDEVHGSMKSNNFYFLSNVEEVRIGNLVSGVGDTGALEYLIEEIEEKACTFRPKEVLERVKNYSHKYFELSEVLEKNGRIGEALFVITKAINLYGGNTLYFEKRISLINKLRTKILLLDTEDVMSVKRYDTEMLLKLQKRK